MNAGIPPSVLALPSLEQIWGVGCGPNCVLNSSSTCTWSSQAYETDGHTRINTDNRTECAALRTPSVFHTSDGCPAPRKWLSSSCCYWLPGRTPISLALTQLNCPPSPILRGWLHPLSCSTLDPPSLSRGAPRQGLVGGVNPIWGRACEPSSPCAGLLTPPHPTSSPPPSPHINALLRATGLTPIQLQ